MLPTSADDGMIEFVPSVSLARVLAEHRSIHRFLTLHNSDPDGTRRYPCRRTGQRCSVSLIGSCQLHPLFYCQRQFPTIRAYISQRLSMAPMS